MSGDPSLIRSSERLAALHRLALLDTPAEPGFDRLTRLASRLLHAPVALVSLVDADRQFFKSSVGLAEPLASARATPLSHSFCQYAVMSGQPLIINDARMHPLVHDNPAIRELGAVAYAGIPLILPDGSAIGTLCAIDNVPREWTEEEIATVHDLAASVITEIALRDDVTERKRSEAALHMAKRELEQRVAERTSELRTANRQLQIELHERTRAEATARRLAEQRKFLLEVAQSMVSTLALDDILRQFQHALHEVLVYDSLALYWVDEAAGVFRPAVNTSSIWMRDNSGAWTIPLGSGIIGAVAQSGRAELVNDAHLDPRSVYPAGAVVAREHLISIPIPANDKTRGVFIMSRSAGPPFSETEVDLVRLFISYVSLAIENAQLFEQTKIAEERQRLLIEQLPATLWTTDREMRFTSSIGPRVGDRRGQPNPVVGISFYDHFQTDAPDYPPIAAQRRALAGEATSYQLERNGRVFQTHVEPFLDAQGQIIGTIGISEDITERVRNEQALRESEERFAKAFRASPVSITITALASGKFIDVNDSFLDLMGYSREEVIGHTSVELGVWANSDDRARVAQALRERRSIRSMEIPFRARSGAIIETLASMELIDLNGERCILALTQDITRRRRTEAALRESEERYRRLSEVSFEGIAIHDHGIILDANTTQAKMLGYEPGEIIGMNVLQFATPESREIILRNIRAGYEGPYEVVGVRKDGTTFPVEVQAKAFAYQGRRVRVAAIRDITKRKQAEQERERLIAELTEALASVKTLSGMLPICASCKKIRDDSGYWNQIESYIQAHSDAVFSHGICPDCMKRLYGDLDGE